jgi:hypothetical protein
VTVPTDTEGAPLFYGAGASWRWVLTGPLAAVTMLLTDKSAGYGWPIPGPVTLLVVVSALVALQVKAARVHTSVELTGQPLRPGTETIGLAEIVQVYPDAEHAVVFGNKRQRWQLARALGEPAVVPRGRTGIGLRLIEGRTAQAWARRQRLLRAALTGLVEERVESAIAPDVQA